MPNVGAPTETILYFTKQLTGGIDQLTTDKTIWASKVEIQVDPATSGDTFIGTRNGGTSAPSTLDITSCIAKLMPGVSYSPNLIYWTERGGGQFQLEQFFIKGPADAYVHVSYTAHGTGVF